MDLEILEALALADNRADALQQLLPGSEDHDYFRCLHAQQRGALDDAQTVIDSWVERHGSGERYERLRLRQLWYRLQANPADVADDVRDEFSVSHWHEADAPEVDATRPTQLAAGAFDGAKLLEEAIAHSTDLSQVTDDGLYELLDRPLDPQRRRALLSRIGHTPHAELVRLVHEDLAAKGSSGFGSLRIHGELTLAQLQALGARRPDLHTDGAWVEAVVRRLRPPSSVDLELDRAAREAYLVELWKFLGPLPPANNELKAHVLWHLLDTLRRRNAQPDVGLVIEYLKLPRAASFVASAWAKRFRNDQLVQVRADFRAVTDLPPAGDDEELVRDLVQRRLGEAEQLAQWLDRTWLDQQIATGQLLAGTADSDRATLVLGAARAAELRERIDIEWCLHNPTRFAADEPIVLEADVKHVPELVVKVFRIDPLAYFQIHRREVSTDVDLDGLAASHELVLRFAEPPIRRVRRRIELPMCSRAGTYVIDLIGNGRSSRTVVHKARLRYVSRIGAAGLVVTILDEAGTPQPDAHAWIGDREYRCDAEGTFVVPFSTAPGATPMLIACGNVATVSSLVLVREHYDLGLELRIDRQALIAGATVRAVARVRLTVAGEPASLALLEQAMWDVTLTDRHGVSTTKQFPLSLANDDAAMLEWPLGESTASVHVRVHGKVKVISEQREQELAAAASAQIAGIHATLATEALYLARTTRGFVLYALGKSGEPRAQRPLTVSLVHRWAHTQLNVELATDAQGRCELGELPGIAWISATLGTSQMWQLFEPDRGGLVQANADDDLVLPISAYRSASELLRRVSFVETRAGVPIHHVATAIEPLEGALAIRGLSPGEYVLRAPGMQRAIRVADSGAQVAGNTVTPGDVVELSRPVPAIAELTVTDALRVRIVGAGPSTRVHAIATRFAPAALPSGGPGTRHPTYRFDRARAVAYVSGRDIGDEYRYVLERRNAKRFPSLLLAKPSLLLNPWARRTTTTDVAVAAPGGGFGAAAPAPAQAARYREAQIRAGGADDGSYASYDFLAAPPVVLANLVPDERGIVTIARGDLGDATCVAVIVDDPAGSSQRFAVLDERPLAPRDLRLRLALDPARHATQKKTIAPLRTGERIEIEDLATAQVHLIDSVERAHAYLLGLGDEATLREFAFITRWHHLPDGERRELYSKYACHELHLFLYGKDRAFFDEVIRPYLAHKRTKTFIDHWLLDADLMPYLEPARLAELNAVERALLARRLAAEPAIARLLVDEVNVQPPDPARDMRIIDALLGAATLDADEGIAGYKADTTTRALAAAAPMAEMTMAPPGAPRAMPASPPPKMKKAAGPAGFDRDEMLESDYRRRAEQAPMFRVVDRTQEWAENNWWHRRPAESDADMIEPNRLWRDLAQHREGPFLSPWLGLATSSFAEAMCALAFVDLPFVAGDHAITADGPRLTIAAAKNALAGSSQLVDGELVSSGPPLVVGQSYVRTDDRYRWIEGEQVDKYVEGSFLAGIVYTCIVVLANPTSSRQRISALVQIPRGSIALAGARATQTIDVVLEPYGTHGHEYSFYFPAAGTYTHFPVHVSRGELIVAAAPARTLDVTTSGETLDPHSWPHISQRGSLADVVAFLDSQNLADVDLDRVAWRLRERAAYDAILGALERRRAFDDTLWGYSLLHLDRPRVRVWARALGERLLAAGPVLEPLDLDAEVLGGYEHLELAPLINARAHRLGAKLRILNDGLSAQYQRFLDFVAHRTAPTAEDLLAATMYLLAQDRDESALAMLARIDPSAVADRMQYDYLAAYAACLTGDVARARSLVTPWREHPVDRWRHKFEALAAMLAELDGAAPSVVDPRSREQQQAELAAKQPAFELAVDRDGVIIRQQHTPVVELRFFAMDVELLFSRQPFVQSDVSRFSFIEPGHRETIQAPPAELRIAWPAALQGKNVVVEVVGAGQRKAKIHYANDLATNLSHQYGQLRIQRASDRAPLAATYVKVYAQKRGGVVAFYKDGYTDLRGWFDYASLSTNDLDHVERFAILVASDQAGSAILEANPPAR